MFNKLISAIIASPYYNIIRYNRLTDNIVELKEKKTKHNIDFYSAFLNPQQDNMLIFDVGANKGNKIKAFLKMGFEVVAFEPGIKSLETLNWRFKNNPKVTIVHKGVSSQEGELTMYVTAARSGLNTLSKQWVESLSENHENRFDTYHNYNDSYKVEVTTLNTAIQQFGMPYFIKIDVEGLELDVINGLNTLPHFISFEVNLPEFRTQSIEIIKRLTNLEPKLKYNYSVHDKLELSNWLDATEITSFIESTNIRYFEIIASK